MLKKEDVLGSAISDYYHNRSGSELYVHNRYGEKEIMPVDIFFRSAETMPGIELLGLQECKGKVLDIGAGAGTHSLLLQQQGFDVTALEISPLACTIMKERGIRKIINTDIFSYSGPKFNTLLLMMNGIGVCATIAGLRRFFQLTKNSLFKKGRIIFDSSDVAYLYDHMIPNKGIYYGEIEYRYEYKKQMGEWFTWLYIDTNTLINMAEEQGFSCSIIFEDVNDHYLACLSLQ